MLVDEVDVLECKVLSFSIFGDVNIRFFELRAVSIIFIDDFDIVERLVYEIKFCVCDREADQGGVYLVPILLDIVVQILLEF